MKAFLAVYTGSDGGGVSGGGGAPRPPPRPAGGVRASFLP